MSEQKEKYDLPEGWKRVKLKDISLRIHYGYTASAVKEDTGIRFLRITDIQDSKVNWQKVPFCTIQSSNIDKFLLKEGDIVFARTGATVGKSFLIPQNIPKSVFASYLIRIELSQLINPTYVYYFFQTADYWRQVGIKAVGIGQPNVNATSLSNIDFPLCPQDEQIRIVSKLEELLSSLDKSKEQLETAIMQIKYYGQLLMEDIFSKNNSGKLEKLGKLLKFIGSGVTPKGGKGVYTHTGVIFLRSQNVYPNKLELDNVAYISKELHEKMNRTHVVQHDVLLNITGASIGRCAFVPSNFKEANVNQHVCILRPIEGKLFYKYLSTYLNSPVAQKAIMEAQTGATRQGLNYSQIKNLEILLPSIETQEVMITTYEERKSICDKTEHILLQNIIQIDTLKQTILKRAFEGTLIEQNTFDESALNIIEKIELEKMKILADEKTTKNNLPKDIQMDEKVKNILEVLQDHAQPIPAKQLWQLSDRKGDIDAFYAELKSLIESGKVIEMPRVGKDSFLRLSE
ncbi:restriction endonuclease subunit S [Chitinophaga sp. XS-30]|uniref:restriction endonuclease subunit S n=1 Tax=Chitinophaga sp. XS-30 TaxID=2604421 RepID=UPI0011DDA229|nr:restriction endonuclease subunit S [Chitinophaga sp. XS-30]QEH42854.1 hypothetical protein FW415_19060 [Chitinophaga sp. XS-30]